MQAKPRPRPDRCSGFCDCMEHVYDILRFVELAKKKNTATTKGSSAHELLLKIVQLRLDSTE